MLAPRNGSPGKVRAVEVLSVEANGVYIVRFLGGYDGTMMHWLSGRGEGRRSHPCPGVNACAAGMHRNLLLWKGYAPVEVWDGTDLQWYVQVLEITENLELLLRGRDLRGEEWGLERPQPTRKRTPVQGRFITRLTTDMLRPEFDFRPIVQRIYRDEPISWGVPNPIAPRVFMEPAGEDRPEFLRHASVQEQAPLSHEEYERLYAHFFRAQGTKAGGAARPAARPAQPSPNGQHGKGG